MRFYATFGTESKLNDGVLVIRPIADAYIEIQFITNLSIHPEAGEELLKYINLLNMDKLDGNFCIGFKSGILVYKNVIYCYGLDSIPDNTFSYYIHTSISVIEQYSNSILRIAGLSSSAETEYNKL